MNWLADRQWDGKGPKRKLGAMKYHISYWLYVTVVTIVICVILIDRVVAQEPDSVDTGWIIDGPYVSLTDSGAVVDWICQGRWTREVVALDDTILFQAHCENPGRTYRIPLTPPVAEPYLFEGVSKIFAISDIHGEYEHLRTLLTNAGVIDGGLHWQFGDGHLVIVGDIFDRGANVTEVLWLIYALEQEARRSVGRVHYILGNHEIMPLQGDLRYVNEKYEQVVALLPDTSYSDLFGPETVLGQWLRTKPIAIRINDILFVHAGINPEIPRAGYSLGMINRLMREHIDVPRDSIKADEQLSYFFRSFGPVWYRGLVNEYNSVRATDQDVDEILASYGATKVVVGHSELDSVSSFYDGRVFDIDIPVEDLAGLHGLLWESGRFYRVLSDGTREDLD